MSNLQIRFLWESKDPQIELPNVEDIKRESPMVAVSNTQLTRELVEYFSAINVSAFMAIPGSKDCCHHDHLIKGANKHNMAYIQYIY